MRLLPNEIANYVHDLIIAPCKFMVVVPNQILKIPEQFRVGETRGTKFELKFGFIGKIRIETCMESNPQSEVEITVSEVIYSYMPTY